MDRGTVAGTQLSAGGRRRHISFTFDSDNAVTLQ
jgi:hypothetical protein